MSDKIKEEPTVEEVLRWLKKLETLSSEGAKVAHVKTLLTKASQATRERDIALIEDMNEELKKEARIELPETSGLSLMEIIEHNRIVEKVIDKAISQTRERDIEAMMKKAREYHNAKMYPKTYLRAAEQFESALNNLE